MQCLAVVTRQDRHTRDSFRRIVRTGMGVRARGVGFVLFGVLRGGKPASHARADLVSLLDSPQLCAALAGRLLPCTHPRDLACICL